MRCADSSLTTFTTNSPVSRMLARVSLSSPSRRLPAEIMTVGGELESAWKYENGAALRTPPFDTVDTHAMGRGTTQVIIRK